MLQIRLVRVLTLFTLYYCPSTALLTIHNYSLYNPTVQKQTVASIIWHNNITTSQHHNITSQYNFLNVTVSFSRCLHTFSIKSAWFLKLGYPNLHWISHFYFITKGNYFFFFYNLFHFKLRLFLESSSLNIHVPYSNKGCVCVKLWSRNSNNFGK